jgi:hypothetical protein
MQVFELVTSVDILNHHDGLIVPGLSCATLAGIRHRSKANQ